MRLGMRRPGLLALCALAACSSEDPNVFEFGHYAVKSQEDFTSRCVQTSLNNPQPFYITAVELTTGPGFHPSNWSYVPSTCSPAKTAPSNARIATSTSRS